MATTKFTVDAQTGNTAVFGTLGVTGAATLSNTLTVTQGATLSSTLNVAGVATMQNNVIMSAADASLTAPNTGLKIKSTLAHVDVEDVRFSGSQIGISGDEDLISLASGALTITGTLSLDDDFKVATTKFTVDAQTGNTAVFGTLRTAATLSNTHCHPGCNFIQYIECGWSRHDARRHLDVRDCSLADTAASGSTSVSPSRALLVLWMWNLCTCTAPRLASN